MGRERLKEKRGGFFIGTFKCRISWVLSWQYDNDKTPANMLDLFQKTSSNIHSYNTRSSTSGKFYVKSSSQKTIARNTKQLFLSARGEAVE